jgi:hypothetical protein
LWLLLLQPVQLLQQPLKAQLLACFALHVEFDLQLQLLLLQRQDQDTSCCAAA